MCRILQQTTVAENGRGLVGWHFFASCLFDRLEVLDLSLSACKDVGPFKNTNGLTQAKWPRH